MGSAGFARFMPPFGKARMSAPPKLTNNDAIFQRGPRKGTTAFESLLKELGVVTKHSRPYHPAVSRGVSK